MRSTINNPLLWQLRPEEWDHQGHTVSSRLSLCRWRTEFWKMDRTNDLEFGATESDGVYCTERVQQIESRTQDRNTIRVVLHAQGESSTPEVNETSWGSTQICKMWVRAEVSDFSTLVETHRTEVQDLQTVVLVWAEIIKDSYVTEDYRFKIIILLFQDQDLANIGSWESPFQSLAGEIGIVYKIARGGAGKFLKFKEIREQRCGRVNESRQTPVLLRARWVNCSGWSSGTLLNKSCSVGVISRDIPQWLRLTSRWTDFWLLTLQCCWRYHEGGRYGHPREKFSSILREDLTEINMPRPNSLWWL